jgi:hypothetical protein
VSDCPLASSVQRPGSSNSEKMTTIPATPREKGDLPSNFWRTVPWNRVAAVVVGLGGWISVLWFPPADEKTLTSLKIASSFAVWFGLTGRANAPWVST